MKFEKEVEAGITLLHERHPGWYWRIDLDKLHVRRTQDCIIGQLYCKNFLEGLVDLGFYTRDRVGLHGFENYVCHLVNGRNATEHGFALDTWRFGDEIFDVLTETWRHKILELRHQDVRDRAYYLWEEAGRPDGQADMFWCAAEQMV